MSTTAGRELLIRADANRWIGKGHLMRCMALGQAWTATGGHVAFVTACEDPSLLTLLRDEGFEVHELTGGHPDPGDWEATRRVLSAFPEAWVVTDGYHLDTAYQRRIRDDRHALLVIDDVAHLASYAADVLLNQNLHAASVTYSCESDCKLLLGPRYALLRREFITRKDVRRDSQASASRLLVTLGGGDPHNVTLHVLQALRGLEGMDLEIRAVVGRSHPHYDRLKETAEDAPVPTRLESGAISMSDLMAWADLAISAGGSTCWELAFMGVPNLVLTLFDNQRPTAEHLEAEGVSVNLGWYEDLQPDDLVRTVKALSGDAERRSRMARRGRSLVDGAGAARVIQSLLDEEAA